MKTIWKYEISPCCKIQVPKNGKVLTVQVQRNQPCLWILVDPNAKKEVRKFVTYGTGHEIKYENGKYIGTFQIDNDNLVFHVFEE